jgi:hypothetical protein
MYNKGGGAWTDLSLVKSILSPAESDEIRLTYPVKDSKGSRPSSTFPYKKMEEFNTSGNSPRFYTDRTGNPISESSDYDPEKVSARTRADIEKQIAARKESARAREIAQFGSAGPPDTVEPSRRRFTRVPLPLGYRPSGTEKPSVEDVQSDASPVTEQMEPEDKQANEDLATVNAGKFQPLGKNRTIKQQNQVSDVLSAIRAGRQVGPLDAKTRALLQEGWTTENGTIRRPKMSSAALPNDRVSSEKFREISDRNDRDDEGNLRQKKMRADGADVPFRTPREAHESNESQTGTPVPVWLGGKAPGSEVTNPDPRATALRALTTDTPRWKELVREAERRAPILKRADELDRIRAELARKYGEGTREFSMALQDAKKNMPNFEESEAPAARPARPESPVDVTGTLSGSPSFVPPPRATGRRGVTRATTPDASPKQTAPRITGSKMIEEFLRLLEAGDPRTIDNNGRIISAKKFWENEGRGETFKKIGLEQRQSVADIIDDYDVVDGVAVRKTKKGWSNTMRAEQTQKGTYFAKSGPFPHRMYVEAHVENDRNGAPSTYIIERNLINVMVKSMGIPEYEVKRRLARIDKSAYSEE